MSDEVADLTERWNAARRVVTMNACSACERFFVIGDLVFVFADPDRPAVELPTSLCPDCTMHAVEEGMVPTFGTVFVDDPAGSNRHTGFMQLRAQEQDRIAEAFRILDSLAANLAKVFKANPSPPKEQLH